ncbi:MAG: hypothetical protein IKW06_05540 [Clostridia bacterium]|nr:hypothetical protein [Clostridia bacterium]
MANETRPMMNDANEENWGAYDNNRYAASDFMNYDASGVYPFPIPDSTFSNNHGNDTASTQSASGNFGPQESMEAVGNPQNNEEVYQGSFQAVLANNLGYYVTIDFLIGTTEITSKSGILYAVGNNFVTLYEPDSNQYIVCDLFSVKFVTFFRSDPRSQQMSYNNYGYNRNRGGMGRRY